MPTVVAKSSKEAWVAISNESMSTDISSDGEVVIKTSQSHSGSILASLLKLRCNGDFCDITIKSGDFVVKAHKVILASATDYFKGMFLNEAKILKSGVMNFSMPSEVLKQCIEFIYSGKVEVSEESVKILLDASEMMQLSELSRLCVEFLAEKVNIQSCACVIAYSAHYNKNSSNKYIMRFLMDNFHEFSRSQGFKSLKCKVVMYCLDLLQRNNEDCEKLKWNSIISWTEASLEKRKQYFPDLFKKLNLGCFSGRFLDGTIRINELVRGSVECEQLVRDELDANIALAMSEFQLGEHSRLVSLKKLDGIISDCLVTEKNMSTRPLPIELELNCEMDLIYFQGSIYIGTGLKIYRFSEGAWTCKDVDFSIIGKYLHSDKCSGCPREAWCLEIKNHAYEIGGSRRSGCEYSVDTFSGFKRGEYSKLEMSFRVVCKSVINDQPTIEESCYSRCIGVEDSVYMFTKNYVIEYETKASMINYHNVPIGLGNGFFLAAFENRIYAIGGDGTEDKAVEFDLLTCNVIPLPDTNPKCSFGFAVFKEEKLYVTDSGSLVTKCYDLETDRLGHNLKKTARTPDGTKIVMNISHL